MSAVRRILVVHNGPGERARWKAVLEGAGFRTVEAATREEGLAILREGGGEIELLLTAVMDESEGLRLVVDAVEFRGTLPVIIAAQAGHPAGVQKGFALLLEPFSDEELVEAARALLYSSRST